MNFRHGTARRKGERLLRLAPLDVSRFWEDGFLVLPQISPPGEREAIATAYDWLFACRLGRDEGDFIDYAPRHGDDEEFSLPQMFRLSRYAPELSRTIFWNNAFAIVRQLTGRPPRLIAEHAMVKPPVTGDATPWHQDRAYTPANSDDTFITIWMPLQDVDEENGCMEFLRGSHRGPVVSHQPIGNDPASHGLEATVTVDRHYVVATPLLAGAATAHHGMVLHRACPNQTPQPRRAYALVFTTRWLPRLIRTDHAWNALKEDQQRKQLSRSRKTVMGMWLRYTLTSIRRSARNAPK
jgi:hypothetical protein